MSEEKKVVFDNGNINISEEVIAVVAGVAASEVNGVCGMSAALGGFSEFFGKKNYSKGVKVEINENEVKISVSIMVEYGCKIPDVAWEVQEKIKSEVENMTGMNILCVDVYVNAISLSKPEKVTETEEKNQNK